MVDLVGCSEETVVSCGGVMQSAVRLRCGHEDDRRRGRNKWRQACMK